MTPARTRRAGTVRCGPRRSQRQRGRSAQRGTTLLEGLIAFLLLSLGMLAIAKVQVRLRADADIPRRQSEAVRIVQGEIEALRMFTVLDAAPQVQSFDVIGDRDADPRGHDLLRPWSADIAQRVTARVRPGTLAGVKSMRVALSWADHTGAARQVTLDTVIAGIDPALSGALGLARDDQRPGPPPAPPNAVPVTVTDPRDAGDAVRSTTSSSAVISVDRSAGIAPAACTSASARTATGVPTIGAPGDCDAPPGLLVSGFIGFDPDAGAGEDEALPRLAVVATTTSIGSAAAGLCSVNRVMPTDPAAPPLLAYRCLVQRAPNGRWSGRLLLLPSDWTIGTGPRDRRVCRYSADLDGSGAIDANIEHPASYADLGTHLPNQNFRVVAGPTPCPAAAPVASDRFVDPSTVQHQP